MNIFLLEDDSSIVSSLTRWLTGREHIVVSTDNLDDAVTILESFDFDKGILDLNVRQFPGGLSNAKSTELLPYIKFPVCIFSGLPDDAEGFGVPVFSKADPISMLAWVESQDQ